MTPLVYEFCEAPRGFEKLPSHLSEKKLKCVYIGIQTPLCVGASESPSKQLGALEATPIYVTVRLKCAYVCMKLPLHRDFAKPLCMGDL